MKCGREHFGDTKMTFDILVHMIAWVCDLCTVGKYSNFSSYKLDQTC